MDLSIRKKRSWWHRHLISVATLLVLAVPGMQSVRADDGTGLQEIVVTATKRETNLQETPLSVQAIAGSTLASLGNDAFRDYAILVPGLSFIDEGAAGPKLTLRGLSTSQYGETQSTVGIYVDEIPATDAGGAAPAFLTAFDLRLHDIDRIEVLRGPQGTLFGADSLGGTIRIITNQPNLQQPSATVESSVSNTVHADGVNYDLDGMVNVPIVDDRLGARLVPYYEHNQGWIDNIGLGQDAVNDETVQGGRLSVLLAATDAVKITGRVNLQQTKRGGFTAETLSLGDFEQDRHTPEDYQDRVSQYNITVNYALAGGMLVSASSYVDRSTVSRLDVTDQFAALLPGLPISNQSTTLQREFTQELRYASASDRPFTYLVGIFYSHLDRTFTQVLPAANADALFNNIGLNFGLPNTLYLAQHDVLFKERAAFGEATLKLTRQLAFTAGLRWFHEGLDGTGFANGALNGGLTQDVASGADNGVLPKFTLSDQITDHDLIYATASKGYRRGGLNPTIPSQIASCQQDLQQIGLTSAPETFNADTVWNYELGTKTQWLGNRLVFNADAYYLDWKGLPGTKILNCGFVFTENAGAARVTGTEAELDARLSRDFALMSTFAFTNAVLTQDFPDLGAVSGQRAPGVPRFTWSAVAQYEHPVSTETQGFANLEYQHVGASYNNFDPATSQHLDQYDMFNLSAGLKASRWQAALFVDNLTNRLAIVNAYDTPFANFVVRTRPRTIGIRGTLSF